MDDELLAYVERVGLWADQAGMPRSMGRVLGWLLVCDPPEVSAKELADGLQASVGSISTALRSLTRSGMVERVAVPGDRTTYVRVTPRSLSVILEGEVPRIQAMRAMTSDGLSTLADAGIDDERADRVRRFHELAEFFLDAWPSVLERWHQQHAPDPSDGEEQP